MPWYWDDFLEKRGVKSNSLGACVEIYNHLLERHGTPYKAIKRYKGIKSIENEYLIYKTLILADYIYHYLQNNLKEQ